MPVQVALLCCSKVAARVCAGVGLLAGVSAHVDGEVVHTREAGFAALLGASVRLLASMHALVLLEVAALTSHKVTARVAASAGGPGACVDAAVHCQIGFALACKATARLRTSVWPVSRL